MRLYKAFKYVAQTLYAHIKVLVAFFIVNILVLFRHNSNCDGSFLMIFGHEAALGSLYLLEQFLTLNTSGNREAERNTFVWKHELHRASTAWRVWDGCRRFRGWIWHSCPRRSCLFRWEASETIRNVNIYNDKKNILFYVFLFQLHIVIKSLQQPYQDFWILSRVWGEKATFEPKKLACIPRGRGSRVVVGMVTKSL